MTITKARSVLLGLALAALTMASTVPAAGAADVRTASNLQAAAATPSQVLDGPACPDVMVIAARGSGEQPSDWQNPLAYTSDPAHGAGTTLYLMYEALEAANPGLTFSLAPAVYPADNISVLFTNRAQYLSDPQAGAESIAHDIQTTDATCGHPVRYILAGYSLGAWAVHDALHELGSRLAEIAGVALFGDPKFQPGQPFVRDFKSEDKYYGVAYKYQPQYNSIPPALVNQTGSWCLPADPVCQYRSDDISTWQSEVVNCVNLSESCAHFQYETDVETLRNAAAFLSPFLPHLYWAYLDQGTIVEANLDGSSPRTIVTGQNGPIGVAVGSSHIYWADGHAGTIMQANLDGTGVTTLVSGQIDAYGVAVNRSHIYWTVVDTGAVMEANLDGTGITTLESGQNTPALMAVDRSHIYWTDEDAGTVMEANLNGTGITTLESGQSSPNGVTVDRSHIYWTDAFGGTVMEANLDGSGVTALVSGQNIPRGVAVGNSHIYWAGGGSIMEANLDGTGVTALEAFQYAIGVAVGPQ